MTHPAITRVAKLYDEASPQPWTVIGCPKSLQGGDGQSAVAREAEG